MFYVLYLLLQNWSQSRLGDGEADDQEPAAPSTVCEAGLSAGLFDGLPGGFLAGLPDGLSAEICLDFVRLPRSAALPGILSRDAVTRQPFPNTVGFNMKALFVTK